MELEKYSMGIGDRFGLEGAAQLRAIQKATANGMHIAPVWNKSKREHAITGTGPEHTRKASDEAVRTCGWLDPYYVDADHIVLDTVDAFLPYSDFFTIDVAEYIGESSSDHSMESFFAAMTQYKDSLTIPGMHVPVQITEDVLRRFAKKYLRAIAEAGKVYRRIAEIKGAGNFVTEVSADEAQSPQTPVELFLILAAIAHEGIPVQTIAPKFTGKFLKGVDYIGDIRQFAAEFQDDLAVIAFSVKNLNLPRNLKLSIHTGSDKFSLYPIMHQGIRKMDVGIHLKTAGTTWLEEVAGLAASGGKALALAKEIYRESFLRYDEMVAPYTAVIQIDRSKLPQPEKVSAWDSEEFLRALRHEPSCKSYNRDLRQLIHAGFKVAAGMGKRFPEMVAECRGAIEENVTANIYERHILPLFFGKLRENH